MHNISLINWNQSIEIGRKMLGNHINSQCSLGGLVGISSALFFIINRM